LSIVCSALKPVCLHRQEPENTSILSINISIGKPLSSRYGLQGLQIARAPAVLRCVLCKRKCWPHSELQLQPPSKKADFGEVSGSRSDRERMLSETGMKSSPLLCQHRRAYCASATKKDKSFKILKRQKLRKSEKYDQISPQFRRRLCAWRTKWNRREKCNVWSAVRKAAARYSSCGRRSSSLEPRPHRCGSYGQSKPRGCCSRTSCATSARKVRELWIVVPALTELRKRSSGFPTT